MRDLPGHDDGRSGGECLGSAHPSKNESRIVYHSFDESEKDHFLITLAITEGWGPHTRFLVPNSSLPTVLPASHCNAHPFSIPSICLDLPQLPCGHEYCRACLEELRQRGVDKSCPLCRKPLPPGPEKLCDLGFSMYAKIKGAIDRSRPGVDQTTPWPPLSAEQQGEMDQAVAMLREAADQGHMQAQSCCGDLYEFGHGVAKDDRLSFVYGEMAAQQGQARSQFNTGVCYCHGRGCEQSYERAAEFQLCTKRIVIPSGVQVHCQ